METSCNRLGPPPRSARTDRRVGAGVVVHHSGDDSLLQPQARQRGRRRASGLPVDRVELQACLQQQRAHGSQQLLRRRVERRLSDVLGRLAAGDCGQRVQVGHERLQAVREELVADLRGLLRRGQRVVALRLELRDALQHQLLVVER
eukprot:4878807-Prymnesium_polylepis.2